MPQDPAAPLANQADRVPQWLQSSISEAARLTATLSADSVAIAAVWTLTVRCFESFKGGGKVISCGNGGSLCDAAHFAEELTGRFRADRAPLPAIAIADAGHITCTANDYGFEQVFSRAITALGKPGDVLVVLSTSGNSANVIRAARAGRERGMWVCGLLGKGGGSVLAECDLGIVFPGSTSDRIQELHMLALHTVVEGVERLMAADPQA